MSKPAWAGTSWSRPGKQLTRAAAGLCAFVLASSVLATPAPRAQQAKETTAAPSTRLHVVVLVLDGVRHQEIFGGVDLRLAEQQSLPEGRRVPAAQLMPRLHHLGQTGGATLGAPGVGQQIRASGPEFVSLPGYSEILTGQRVSGCENNGCKGTRALSIADELSGTWKTAVVTSWPDISRIAARGDRVAVSCGRSAGATRAAFEATPRARAALKRAESEAPWPGYGDFRRDRFTGELALSYLTEQRPGYMMVSLGEPDEFAHQGNYAGYLDSLLEADAFIGRLSESLAELARDGARTALFITTDHGRASGFRDHGGAHPESAQVWLVAAGSAIGARGRVPAPSERRLADLSPTVRLLFGLPPDTSRFAGHALSELVFWGQGPQK